MIELLEEEIRSTAFSEAVYIPENFNHFEPKQLMDYFNDNYLIRKRIVIYDITNNKC